MARMLEGSEAIARKLAPLKNKVPEALRPFLVKAGEEIAADMRTLAESPRRTGDLIESIQVTGPGETTPAHSADGGQLKAGEFEVLVTAGDADTRHTHLVEGGTKLRYGERAVQFARALRHIKSDQPGSGVHLLSVAGTHCPGDLWAARRRW
nr:HK97 gp10 family phage protein [Sinirhodobacter populi]